MTRFFIFTILLTAFSFASIINIGVILPLTGNASIDGIDGQKAIKLANSLFGNVRNYSLKIIINNNRSNPLIDKAETLNLIINKDVKVIIGWYYSSHAFGGTPIAEKYKIPGVCIYATNPLITQGKKYISRIVFDDNFQGEATAYYIFRKLGIRKIGVVRDISQEYSIGLTSIFEANFRSLGGHIIKTYNINSSIKNVESSVKNAVSKISDDGVEALYMPIYSAQIASFLKIFHRSGKTIFIFGSDSAGFVTNYLKDKSLANGLYYTDQYFVNYKNKNAMAKMFDREYYKKYGSYPNSVAAYLSFDAYYLVYNAIKKCLDNNKLPTAKNINYFIRHTKNLLATTGHLTIDSKTGGSFKSIYILKYNESGRKIFVDKMRYTSFYGDK